MGNQGTASALSCTETMYSVKEGMPPDLVVPGDDLEVAGLLLDGLKSSLNVTDSGINLRACVKY